MPKGERGFISVGVYWERPGWRELQQARGEPQGLPGITGAYEPATTGHVAKPRILWKAYTYQGETQLSMYRLYVDESGDHTYTCLEDPAKRYLGLTGCVIEKEYYRTEFHPALEAFKQKHFPHDPDNPIILHRSDIINRRGPFWRLREEHNLQAFNHDLLEFLRQRDYVIISVVIDKKAHTERYAEAGLPPYHECLVAMMARYCGFLNFHSARGDVMAESRGGREDKQLRAAYENVFLAGTQRRRSDFFQRLLTSKELKLKPKSANISGLQLADVLAHPCKQEILRENGVLERSGETFGMEICNTVGEKYAWPGDQATGRAYHKVFLR